MAQTVTFNGADTSKFQSGNMNWEAYKNAGGTFGILRIGYSGVKDPYFESDFTKICNAGLLKGVYIYSYADTIEKAEKDAKDCIKWLGGKKLDMPIFFDIEDAKQKYATLATAKTKQAKKDLNSAMYNAFAKIIKENGYGAGMYTGESFYNTYFNLDTLDHDMLWIAKYSTKSPKLNDNHKIDIWQYTSGEVNNSYYKGKLDRNYWYVEVNEQKDPEPEPQIITGGGLNPTTIESDYLKEFAGDVTIRDIQHDLNVLYLAGLVEDGKTGPKTRAAMAAAIQRTLNDLYSAGLVVDGKFGQNSTKAWAAHIGTLSSGSKGLFVAFAQAAMLLAGHPEVGTIDGKYGAKTTATAKAIQKQKGISQTGKVTAELIYLML